MDEISNGPTEAQNQQLLALREATLAISANLDLAQTLKRIVAAAADLVSARYAALGVPDSSGEFLAEFVTSGMTSEEEARISHRPRGHGLLGVLLHDGQTLRLHDLATHPRSVGFPPNHPHMTSLLGVPIVHKERRVGDLYLCDKRGAPEFTADDQHLIELLAAHAGVAIENARLYSRVQHLTVVEERQRIGMDLHDGVIQSIYAVGLTLEYIQGQLAEGNTDGAQQRLQKAVEALNATIRDIRAYILDLRPRRFDGANLVVGLQQLLEEFKANTLMNVEVGAEALADQALLPEARLALFHIAQEALSNTAKHSRASRVTVRLRLDGGQVVLALEDNGRGFDPDQVQHRLGHGLANMHDRAAALGGELKIGRPAEGGTRVQASIPRHDGAPPAVRLAPPP